MRILEILLEYRTPVEALNTLLALWRRQQSTSSGEVESSKNLYKNILAKVAKEFGIATANQMNQYILSGQADEDDSKLKPAKRDAGGNIIIPAQQLTWPPYNFQTRQQQKPQPQPQPQPKPQPNTGNTKGTKSGNWEFIRVLRFIDLSAGKRGSDKIWGYAKNTKTGEYIAFWGAYGKIVRTLQKSHPELLKTAKSKLAKGYYPIDITKQEYIYLRKQADLWSQFM